MSKSSRFFRREFLAKSDDDSESTAVIARVSNNADNKMTWLSASLMLGSVEGFDSNFFLSFFAEEPEELKRAMQQVDTLKKVISDFADAVSAEIEALNSSKE